jgi:hypothetical protein
VRSLVARDRQQEHHVPNQPQQHRLRVHRPMIPAARSSRCPICVDPPTAAA